MITRHKILVMTLLIAVMSPLSLLASPNADQPSFFDRIHTDEIMEATLEVNIDYLLEKKKTNDYHAAVFAFADGTGKEHRWPIEVRARGRFRRVYGAFPPLKMKFPKEVLLSRGMNKHNDLKLVTNMTGTQEGDDYVLREYLIYKMYQQLSPNSYRVQLLHLTFKNIVDGVKTTSYAIIIEDTDEMVERLNGESCKDCFGMTDDLIQKEAAYTNALFQYMIGNTDWSIEMSRNLKLVKLPDGKHVPVPYDFDFSGVVNASYAYSRAELGQKKVTDRIYLGNMDKKALAPIIDHFRARRNQIMDLVDNFDVLSRGSRREIKKYLDQFFIELENGFNPKLPVAPPTTVESNPEIN